MPEHQVGTQQEHDAARVELLAEEKELTRRSDELARKRRELPWVAVEKDYRFETGAGTRSLAELFDGRSQLLVYHFMFGPPYEAGCPVCTSIGGRSLRRSLTFGRGTQTCYSPRVHRSTSFSPTGSGWGGTSTGCRCKAATSTATSASSTPRRSSSRG